MRVTNAGILGNAFYNVGRSSDPSFEYPAYSGIELLNHAELWVGAIDADGETHVSGGPMLEFRPTLDAADHVRLGWRSNLGARRRVDDDSDGRIDEEVLNGKDDDGDGVVDEDLALITDQVAAADYVDDRPEAVSYGYPTGETHRPFGLSVHQEVGVFGAPDYDGAAILTFHVTNHSDRRLRQVYLGLFADLDVRRLSSLSAHRSNRIATRTWSASKFEGQTNWRVAGAVVCGGQPPCPPVQCFSAFGASVPVVSSGIDPSMPVVALMPIDHTIDPLARIAPNLARAPATLTFRSTQFDAEGIPGGGGPPRLDVDRYSALAGSYVQEQADRSADWTTLLSCGPFRTLEPGASLDFTVAIMAASNADSLMAGMARMALLRHGEFLDLVPNETVGPQTADYDVGISGVSGHEMCLEPPLGESFFLDPDCTASVPGAEELGLMERPITIEHGQCVWTNVDCDICTGLNGRETQVPWLDPGQVPPAPETRITPGDGFVTVDWNNLPEVKIAGGLLGGPASRFVGYRVYKLARWSPRESLLLTARNWQLLGTFMDDSVNHEVPLHSITDDTLAYEGMLFEQKLFPVGRYRLVDREVLNGFDYVYAVSTIFDCETSLGGGVTQVVRRETPLIARFDDRVTPHTASRPAAGAVTVVPNPFRARADWDRAPVFGDPLPRHLDFMHLPKALCTIRIYTLAGDLVDQIDHDARSGDGQASWDLISRNGQDVESGVYLFTVDSTAGHQVGKFVVVR